MKKDTVAFISLQEYDNLGVGYMAAVLSLNGFRSKILDIRYKNQEIYRKITSCKPLIIGFSVVHHGCFKRFEEIIRYLRPRCENIHFTAGGHYATLNTDGIFSLLPELDSIVRFEGEYTILDLARKIQAGSDWRAVAGIAFKNQNQVIRNSPRPLEKDLDRFPYPYRPPLRKFAFEMPCVTMLAGRGCIYNCTFCNTRSFYSEAGGPLKRIRKPEMVAAEINYLNKFMKCYIFLFVDDDFPIRPYDSTEWISDFCSELRKYKLDENIMWKICCRPDEVYEPDFRLMKAHGLFSVFMGIEDGTDQGLGRLNKKITVERILGSITILKKLKIGIDYGFMLFQPNTTFRSLKENLDFLLTLFADGYSSLTFLKLLPFYKTKVESDLMKEGRLKLKSGEPDYDFQEAGMNEYYNYVTECFRRWLRHPNGVHNLSVICRNYFLVFSKCFSYNPGAASLKHELKKTISESNLFLIGEMKYLSGIFESGFYDTTELEKHKKLISDKDSFFAGKVYNIINRLYSLAFRNLLSGISNSKKHYKILA